MYGSSAGAGVYPDALVPESGAIRARSLVYFDVSIDRTARPGWYQGELAVDERIVPVHLEVSPARIELGQEPLVWVFYLPSEIARAHGLADEDGGPLGSGRRA